jgi:hypothetical protein
VFAQLTQAATTISQSTGNDALGVIVLAGIAIAIQQPQRAALSYAWRAWTAFPGKQVGMPARRRMAFTSGQSQIP